MRLERTEATEADFSPAERKHWRGIREAQNAKLMKLAMGETDIVPMFQYTPLPGAVFDDGRNNPNADLNAVESKSHIYPDVILRDNIENYRMGFEHRDDTKRETLKDNLGIVVPVGKPALAISDYQAEAEEHLSNLDTAQQRGECLYHNYDLARPQASVNSCGDIA